jgi:hypothetical protein
MAITRSKAGFNLIDVDSPEPWGPALMDNFTILDGINPVGGDVRGHDDVGRRGGDLHKSKYHD